MVGVRAVPELARGYLVGRGAWSAPGSLPGSVRWIPGRRVLPIRNVSRGSPVEAAGALVYRFMAPTDGEAAPAVQVEAVDPSGRPGRRAASAMALAIAGGRAGRRREGFGRYTAAALRAAEDRALKAEAEAARLRQQLDLAAPTLGQSAEGPAVDVVVRGAGLAGGGVVAPKGGRRQTDPAPPTKATTEAGKRGEGYQP